MIELAVSDGRTVSDEVTFSDDRTVSDSIAVSDGRTVNDNMIELSVIVELSGTIE